MKTEITKLIKRWVFILAVLPLFACDSMNEAQMLQQADDYLQEKKLRNAVIELKNILQTNPENAEARFRLGELNMDVGNLAAAEKEFSRAQKHGWPAEEAVIGRMRAQFALRKFEEIIAEPAADNSWSPTAQANQKALKAVAHAGKGDLLQAKTILLAAEELDADAYDVLKGAILLQLSGKQLEDAGVTISRALELFADDNDILLLSANFEILNKEHKKAIALFQQVVAASPDNMVTLNARRAHIGLIKLGVLEKDFDVVRKSRDVLMSRSADDLEVNYYLAVASFAEKEYDQSEILLQKIMQVTDKHQPTLLLSGAVSFAKKNYEKAAYFLISYLANQPENLKARKLLGRTYMALGKYDEASNEFKSAKQSNVDDPELIALIGLSEISDGNIQLGVAELEKALSMAPDSVSLKQQLAKAYIAKGQVADAIKQLDELLEKDNKNFQVKYMKVLAYLNNQDIKMAVQTAEELLAEDPVNPDVLNLLGNIQIVAKDEVAAREYFNKALNADAGHVSSSLNLARLDEAKGDVAAAEKRYLSILEVEPNHVRVMNNLARLAAAKNDSAGQIKWSEAVRKADAKDVVARVTLVEAYLKQGKIAVAEQLVRELEEAHKNSSAVLIAKSRLLMAQKRNTEAESIILAFIDSRPDQDIGYYLQAQNQLLIGKKAEALANIRKAYQIKPDELRNMILLARLERRAGNFLDALKLAEEVIDKAPDSAVGHVLVGDSRLAAKDFRKAQEAYDQAWSITQSRETAVRRFKVARRLSDLDAATAILKDWLVTHEDDATVTLELATALLMSKQNKEAISYFEKVLTLQDKNITALNNLAWLYSLSSDSSSLARALELSRAAYTIDSGSPGVMDTYGWVLLKNNKNSEALDMLKRAAEKLPNIPEVQYHYAKALYKSGDKSAAKGILETLIATGRAFDGRDDAEMMLK